LPFQPVIVSRCDKLVNKELWRPHAFAKEFGHIENDLVNCFNHVVLLGHKMKTFWDGFEKISCTYFTFCPSLYSLPCHYQ
jgi:lysine-specific demethylase 3